MSPKKYIGDAIPIVEILAAPQRDLPVGCGTFSHSKSAEIAASGEDDMAESLTEANGNGAGRVPPAPPTTMPKVRAATVTDIVHALEHALRDFRKHPFMGLFFGFIYAGGGLLLIWLTTGLHWTWATFPLAAGFALVGPFIAVGLYEISRREEQGLPVTWPGILSAVFAQGGREMGWMALVSVFAFVIWMYQIRLLFAGFFGVSATVHGSLWQDMIGTSNGLLFLTVGTVWGAVLSVIVFTLTVVSFPLLLDRDVDFITAMIASVKAVVASPVVMIGWGLITAAVLLVAIVPGFLGLLVALPVLGHATWHLYRRIVTPAPGT
jgi:uncharacterized membrane protein